MASRSAKIRRGRRPPRGPQPKVIKKAPEIPAPKRVQPVKKVNRVPKTVEPAKAPKKVTPVRVVETQRQLAATTPNVDNKRHGARGSFRVALPDVKQPMKNRPKNYNDDSRLRQNRCKPRPKDNRGSGGSRSFIPWCK